MASLAELTDNPFVQNTIDSVALRDATDLPKTRIIVRPQNTPDNEPVKQDDNKLQNIIDQLFGLNGKERYQLWPEKLVRDAISAPHDVMTGEIPQYVINPVTGEAQTSPQMIKAGVDASSLAGSGGLAGAGSEAGVALGSAPFLRPALKYGEKLYKGKPGQQHMDVIPADLYPTFQKQTMSGEENSNFKFGFLNHKRQFLNREDALKYAIDNGLVDPHSAQYGALTSTLMSDTAKPGAALAAVANTNKPFYSAVENAIAGAKQPKADAQQWLSFLKNQPGVKQEELAHLGLDKLQGSITKDNLLKAVQEGQPQINVVTKGDNTRFENLNDKRYAGTITPEEQIELNNLRKTSTKYHDYQLPGGENYREMLLTLPDTVKTAENNLNNAIGKSGSIEWGKGKLYSDEIIRGIVNEDLGPLDLPVNLQEPAKKLLDAYRAKNQNQYKSSHWDEPNVLAHIRMNDRTIDGKKTLHLEEIQSDWHQEGRKKGYKNNTAKELTEAQDKELNALSWKDKLNSEEQTRYNELKSIKNEYLNSKKGVPDAPFKKTWDELALKKAITEAVKNGYDQISWTPGEAQAARYDLSKQVDSIKYLKNDDGTYNIVPFKNNRPVHSVEGENIKPEKLPDIVGKEVAEKITNGHGEREKGASDIRVLSGQDLKVGGQGMKAFYDKMLVDKMNALTKKYGGKVEQKDLNSAPTYEIKNPILNKDGKEIVSVYKNGTFLADMEKSEASHYIDNRKSKDAPVKVHVLKITPELREHVLKNGFPLFSAGVPVFTPVEGNPFEGK